MLQDGTINVNTHARMQFEVESSEAEGSEAEGSSERMGEWWEARVYAVGQPVDPQFPQSLYKSLRIVFYEQVSAFTGCVICHVTCVMCHVTVTPRVFLTNSSQVNSLHMSPNRMYVYLRIVFYEQDKNDGDWVMSLMQTDNWVSPWELDLDSPYVVHSIYVR